MKITEDSLFIPATNITHDQLTRSRAESDLPQLVIYFHILFNVLLRRNDNTENI